MADVDINSLENITNLTGIQMNRLMKWVKPFPLTQKYLLGNQNANKKCHLVGRLKVPG